MNKFDFTTHVLYQGTTPNKIILVDGISLSGKTSYIQELKDRYLQEKKDLIVKDYKDLYTQRSMVADIRDLFLTSIEDLSDVIIEGFDEIEEVLLTIARAYSITLEKRTLQTPIEECLSRNTEPKYSTVDIIEQYNTHTNLVYPDNHIKYRYQNENLPKAIIVDLDGTVALSKNRSMFGYEGIENDLPHEPVCRLVNTYYKMLGHKVIFVTGRADVSETKKRTEDWIDAHLELDKSYILYMRPKGITIPDHQLKFKIYNEFIRDKFFIEFVLEDKDSVVKMWRDELNIPTFQVYWDNHKITTFKK